MTVESAFNAAVVVAERSALALQVVLHPKIRLEDGHVSGNVDNATARDNAIQSVFLMEANRSAYKDGKLKGPGGDVGISSQMLRAMLELAKTYSFVVSEIAGGVHGAKSAHYAGVCIDVTEINGEPVSSRNAHVTPFRALCKTLGAVQVLGPGDPKHAHHVHAQWPRPKR